MAMGRLMASIEELPILLVMIDEEEASKIKSNLEKRELKVEVAYDVQQAFTILSNNDVSAIFFSVSLPVNAQKLIKVFQTKIPGIAVCPFAEESDSATTTKIRKVQTEYKANYQLGPGKIFSIISQIYRAEEQKNPTSSKNRLLLITKKKMML